MSQYLINALAMQDIDNIASYLADINLETTDRFLQAFDRKCKQLGAFPLSGKSYPQLRADLRGISFQSYIIFYRILADGIEIMRVVSGRQDLQRLFDDQA